MIWRIAKNESIIRPYYIRSVFYNFNGNGKMINKVHLDFETRSLLDIKTNGSYKYSEDESTSILCCAYAFNDYDVKLRKLNDILVDSDLKALANDPNVLFVAHNAFFERCIWGNILHKKFGMPFIPANRWRCSAAKAAVHGLPQALDKCAIALGLSEMKDETGKRIMLKLSKPRKPTKKDSSLWHEKPEDLEVLYSYCMQDVVVERAIDKALPDLTPYEQKIWELDQSMNDNGIRIDTDLALRAVEISEEYSDKINNKIKVLTDGKVEGASKNKSLSEWIFSKGVSMPNLQKGTVETFIKQGNIPSDVREVLKLKKAISKTSVKKYDAMLNCACSDGRVRDILRYSAASTGRWGGKLIQLQNLPRGTEAYTDVAAEAILKLDNLSLYRLYPDIMATLSSCIRSALLPDEHKKLFVADYSSIEARVLAWLAQETKTLDYFKQGRCVYCAEASQIFGRDITKKDKFERTVGKVATLALGYQGGIGAFGSMAKLYNVDLEEVYTIIAPSIRPEEFVSAEVSYGYYFDKVEEPLSKKAGIAADVIKQRWRRNNPNIIKLWEDVNTAALSAVTNPNNIYSAARSHFYYQGKDFLYCRLPSGRNLAYHKPKIEGEQLTHMTLMSQTKQYIRTSTYGGKLTENITQAVARDIMAHALLNVYNKKDFVPHLTVHDEIITSGPEHESADKLVAQMCELPSWAFGLPITAEGWKGNRYKK